MKKVFFLVIIMTAMVFAQMVFAQEARKSFSDKKQSDIQKLQG